MKRQYWIEIVIGNLYAVKYCDGNFSHTAFEGSENDCYMYISNR